MVYCLKHLADESQNQIQEVITEVTSQAINGKRSLVITITKRMAEDITTFFNDPNNTAGKQLKVAYLHSDIDTLERSKILDDLRGGTYDVLVGINLLREGLDLPEVALVCILDAGVQGFLRSKQALIQIMGRAARNLDGQVILYADVISPAIKEAKEEVNRRRKIQLEYNQVHGITPESIQKSIRPQIIKATEVINAKELRLSKDPTQLTPTELKKYLKDLRAQMKQSAIDLQFEEAIRIRDQILKLEKF